MRELVFYKKMINKSLFQKRVQAMLTWYKIDVIFIDWIIKRSFDKFSLSSRMSLENSTENVKYQWINESNNQIRSQSSNSIKLVSERFMSISFVNQRTQNSEIFSQNQNRRSNSAFNDRPSEFHRFFSRDLSAAEISLNEFVNESKKWLSKDDSLCVKCDELEHMIKDCTNRVFSVWEQFYLRYASKWVGSVRFRFGFCRVKSLPDWNRHSVDSIRFDFEFFRFRIFSISIQKTKDTKVLKIVLKMRS
jgi:hypothetical protein